MASPVRNLRQEIATQIAELRKVMEKFKRTPSPIIFWELNKKSDDLLVNLEEKIAKLKNQAKASRNEKLFGEVFFYKQHLERLRKDFDKSVETFVSSMSDLEQNSTTNKLKYWAILLGIVLFLLLMYFCIKHLYYSS